jgi:tetratricopeptide (TPR) repeat protein
LENNRDWIHLWQKDWYTQPEQQAAEGGYLILKGQLDDAGTLINDQLTIHPDDPRVWFLQARLYLLRKEEKQFRQSLDRAWLLASDNLSLKDEMLRFALESNLYEKVNVMAAELVRKDPTNPEYLIARALARIMDGKESLAIKEIEAAEEVGITPVELYYQAGRKLSASIPQQAEIYLTKAIETGTMDARFYNSRGIVRAALEKSDLALGDFSMSLDINPNQPDLYMNRAQLRLAGGDTDGACHDWKRALGMGNAKAADLLYKYCRLP